MIIRNIFNKLTEWSEQLKQIVVNNDRNPLFYGALFLIGVALFYIVFDALNKDK